MKIPLLRVIRSDSGVSAIEYALLAGLIAVVIVVSVGTAGTQLVALFTYVKTQVVQAMS